ncbi:MAG: glycine--tRNA ligase subunit beta [Rhodocyclales bacterium]|nr:glycine--tRNA ligase subunit beta [Rhodocyclales bacterium]
MSNKNLLVELFVEELPPKALKQLGDVFSSAIFENLVRQGLTVGSADVESYASPRRLGVLIGNVASQAADKSVQQKLMPVSVGMDASGNATPALLKKLASLGADASVVPTLQRQSDGKADVLMLDLVVKGATLAEGLQKALDEALAKLPIPKVMGYQLQDGWTTVNFVRPAHKLIALHGENVIDISVLGLKAGRETLGHRFEAKESPIAILEANDYPKRIEEVGGVIPRFSLRKIAMQKALFAAAQIEGLKLAGDENDPLYDEVTALVENPNVLVGEFEEAFLAVPQECLILTMKANQKYFPLLDSAGKLSNKFLIVSNIRPDDPSAVIEGNERVVRPRLSDAKFFFDQDRKKTLESRVDGLSRVVYHNKLGSQGERVERVRAIARAIAEKLNVDVQQVDTAARLAKADLLTDMVGEFPELQGIMGGYYAKHDGLGDVVAAAIEDHYKPRFAGDALPRNDVGIAVALTDKLETLVGMFGIGQIPTGDKDPFALRRHALGVIRMLIEGNLPLPLAQLLKEAAKPFGDLIGEASAALSDFIFDRLAGNLREQGYSAQEVDAVISLRPQRLGDIAKRLAAVRAFSALPEASALAAANKRVGNILKKVEGEISTEVSDALLKETAEQALSEALSHIAPKANAAFDAGDYSGSLQALAALRAPVDAFFESVMVNAEDAALRANRLSLLRQLYGAMNRVADLSKLSA